MNQATTDVITLLTDPEVNFGADPLHRELLDSPELLRDAVTGLVGTLPPSLGTQSTALTERREEVDWARVAQEFRDRVRLASGFFDPDAATTAVARQGGEPAP